MAGNDAVYASFVSFVVSTVELLSAKVQCRLCSLLCVRRILPMQKTARAAADLPVANKKFAVYPVRNLPSASETLADGKLLLCRRQTKNLPSASAPLAIGKIHV